jgi:hypothetical protein
VPLPTLSLSNGVLDSLGWAYYDSNGNLIGGIPFFVHLPLLPGPGGTLSGCHLDTIPRVYGLVSDPELTFYDPIFCYGCGASSSYGRSSGCTPT